MQSDNWFKENRIHKQFIYLFLIGWTAGLFMTPYLWYNGREFPLVPVIPGLPALPGIVSWGRFALMLLLPWLGVFLKKQRQMFLITFFLTLWAFLEDYSRIQPWLFQYAFYFIVAALTMKNPKEAISIFRVTIVCIYFWAGIHKINPTFFDSIFPWMIEPYFKVIDGFILGFFVPPIEIFTGIGLLFRGTRKLAIAFSFLTHLFVLGSIGPLGHDWNSSVWSWNMVMPFMTLLLFWDTRIPLAFNPDFLWKKLTVVTVLLFFILPSFHVINLWDGYLSFSVYSGKVDYAQFSFEESYIKQLPESARKKAKINKHGYFDLYPEDWSMEEMNSPSYPATRVNIKIFESLCKKANASDTLLMRYWSWNDTTGYKACGE